jgi:hypothetical protein
MKQLTITIMLAFIVSAGMAQSINLKTFTITTGGNSSYMDDDSCWHITDTIGTLNALVKANTVLDKYYRQKINDENKKLIAANNILKQVRITGQIENKRKFLKSVIDYYKILGVKPSLSKYKKPSYLKAI